MGTAYQAPRRGALCGFARSKNIQRFLSRPILLVCLLFPSFAFSATSPIGATAGNFRVSEGGAATYNIPIAVPPGIAGMKPSLSINYSSQGGNGLLGMGWSLGGLSVIHRCPKTVAQDGVMGAVNFDSNDRFCIDGQRLVAITGSYGAPNTEYRTETESYSRIISYGTTGTGPSYFKVWTKGGQIMEYGNSADSRIQPQAQATAMLWALNKVSDTVGNYLTITYTQDQPNGQFYPNRIDYAGNSNTGKTPTNSVQFSYETRPDITPLYQAGALLKTTVRMTNVKTYTGTTLTKDYRLTYNTSAATQRSRIATFTECAGDGVCVNPSSITWREGQAGGWFSFWSNSSTSRGSTANYTHYFADINGDGIADWIQVSNNSDIGWVGLGNTSGNFVHWSNSSTSRGSTSNYTHYFVDVNADGFTDWVQVSKGSDIGWVGLSNASGNIVHWSNSSTSRGSTNNYTHYFGDVNGDGIPDWIQINNASNMAWVGLAKGDGTYAYWSSTLTLPDIGSNLSPYIVDVNGDGKSDIVLVSRSQDRGWIGISRGDGTISPWVAIAGVGAISNYAHYFADVNGDGIADWIQVNNSSNMAWVGLAKGNGTYANWSATLTLPDIGSNLSPYFIDVNGDGKVDFVLVSHSQDVGWVGVSRGDGTNLPWVSLASVGATKNYTHYFADVNGDGVIDWIQVSNNDNIGWVGLNNLSAPDLLATLTTGLGVTTTLTYKPITDSSVYTKDTTAVYPYLDMQSPMYVVSHVTNSDGLGGNYAMDYSYVGAKAHLQGGGYMGFRQFSAHDPQTHIGTTTTFRQTYPYQGMPLTTQKVTDSLVVLSQSTNTYTDTLLNTTLSPVYHQSLLTMSVETSDLPPTRRTKIKLVGPSNKGE